MKENREPALKYMQSACLQTRGKRPTYATVALTFLVEETIVAVDLRSVVSRESIILRARIFLGCITHERSIPESMNKNEQTHTKLGPSAGNPEAIDLPACAPHYPRQANTTPRWPV